MDDQNSFGQSAPVAECGGARSSHGPFGSQHGRAGAVSTHRSVESKPFSSLHEPVLIMLICDKVPVPDML